MNCALVPITEPLVRRMRLSWYGVPTRAVVVLTPAAKSFGEAGVKVPLRSDHVAEDRFAVIVPTMRPRASAAWPLPRGVEWRGLCVPQQPSGGPTGWVVIPSAISTT